jgi:hypothetical protein
MLHSGKARINHDTTQSRLKTKSQTQFHTESAKALLDTGAPLAHVEHMIRKGYVVNDI